MSNIDVDRRDGHVTVRYNGEIIFIVDADGEEAHLYRPFREEPEASLDLHMDPDEAMARAESRAERLQQQRFERWLDNARGRGVRGER